MKKLAILLFFSSVALAQNVRYDAPFPSINSQTAQPFLIANVPPNAPRIAVCHSPANAVPCTNYVTTFTGTGASCPNGAQDTPQPATTSACQTTGDAQGNIGFWVPAGTYDYTVCVTTTCFGPFTITLSIGSGGGTPGGSNTQIQFNNSGVFGAISNASLGSYLVSQGASTTSTFQTMPYFDARSSLAGFDCTGTTAEDTAMQSISSTAHILIPFGCVVRFSSNHTYPQTFEFKQGGGLKVDTGVLVTLTGPIIAGSSQIFFNALPTQGGIDFTGNTNSFNVLPEWWGAATSASAATNTTALQAAIYGAFGCNTSPTTVCRTNASGTSYYNKPLHLSTKYSISGELHWYHTLNFTVEGTGRLFSGIIQTAGNSRIIDGQSNAFGVFRNLSFSSTASQDLSHPLADFNYDTSQGTDLATEYIDFYNILWNGNTQAKLGVRIAAGGGSAQGSTINFYGNVSENFTEAGYMIGNGSGCSPTSVATNAIGINWYGNDMLFDTAYGIEDFGGTNLAYNDGTAENGGFVSTGVPAQSGADFCANEMNAGGGYFHIKNFRSESAKVLTDGGVGAAHWHLQDVRSADNAQVARPGITPTNGDYVQGNVACNHGYYNKISAVSGAFSGLGSRIALLTASSGTTTSITDSVGGFTPNAWVGWQACIFSGTATNEYCLITSNTASTFNCTAGFKTDFPAITVVAPDNTSSYTIEPNWGVQTVSGGVTWAIDNSIYAGIDYADSVFFPGRKFSANSGAILNNVQLTRPDFSFGGANADTVAIPGISNLVVGEPVTAGVGIASIGLASNTPPIRPYTLQRNSLTELAFPLRQEAGTRVIHWLSGVAGGGLDAADIYMGSDSNLPSTGQGDWFVINNSANTAKKWTFNFDGSTTFPGNINSSTGTVNPALYASQTNCSATGTAANPSVASCSAAPAGSFSCATAATGGTCQVNTTAVTANSEIFVTQRADTTTGTRLGVTCNTTLSTAITQVTAVTAGTSFTINLGTINTNPECFSYFIIN